MLHYAIVFFVVALIAAVLGFNGVAGLSAQIGWLFAVLAVVFLAVALLSGRLKMELRTKSTSFAQPDSPKALRGPKPPEDRSRRRRAPARHRI